MKRLKHFLIAGLIPAFFMSGELSAKPFVQMLPMQVLCTVGGPEELMSILLRDYNEVPKYSLRLGTDPTVPQILTLHVLENSNNPSSTFIISNITGTLSQSCVFFSAQDVLSDSEAQSLPAKKPAKGKLDV